MAKAKPINEYVLIYAIFAHHRFKAVTVQATTKRAAIDDFYETHERCQYRIKTVLKINPEDWEKTESHEEIMAKYNK